MTHLYSINWKRFSLRSLLVLMSICCVLLGTWSVYVNPYRLQANSLRTVQQLNGEFVSDAARGSAWNRWIVIKLLGPDAFTRVTRVDLAGRKVTNEDLASLSGLIHLNEINLDATGITDAGVATIARMKHLRRLSLRYTNLSDKSAHTLGSLTELETLYLTGTHLSDSAIDDLAKLASLKEIFVRWTALSSDGADRLRRELPGCEVVYYPLVAEAK